AGGVCGERLTRGEAGRGQTGEAVCEVAAEARLRLLAVAGDVDAGRGLVAHHLRDALARVLGERLLVVGLARLLGSHRDDDRRRSHKAAGVGGEEAVLAVFHDEPSMLLPLLAQRSRAAPPCAFREGVQTGLERRLGGCPSQLLARSGRADVPPPALPPLWLSATRLPSLQQSR